LFTKTLLSISGNVMAGIIQEIIKRTIDIEEVSGKKVILRENEATCG